MVRTLRPMTTTNTNTETLWSIREAARYLGVHTDTARPALQHLAIHLTARTVRYRPEDVREFVEEMRGGPVIVSAPKSRQRARPRAVAAPVRVVRRQAVGA